MLIKIAVVEDDMNDSKTLCKYIDRYFAESEMQYTYQVETFDSANKFLSNYRADHDIAFFDIQMPYLNGMDAAETLRKIDQELTIIFVTSMAQFAVRGYSVNALGFILKPASYYDFRLSMKKAVYAVESKRRHDVVLTTKQEVRRLSSDELYYVEVLGHTLYYHAKSETIAVSGSIADAEKLLDSENFARCHNGFLVNMRAIKSVKGYDILLLNGETIQISHPRKKRFMAQLSEWLGDGKTV